MLDLTPVLPVLFALASAVVAAAVPFVVPLLRRALRAHINAAQAAVIDAAVKRGAGVALGFLQANEGAIAAVPLHNTALAMGAEYVLRRVPVFLKALGLTPDHVQEMVGAELQRAVLVPATVSISAAPAAAPAAPSGAGAPAGGAIASAVGAVVLMGLLAGPLSACGTAAQQAAVATVACKVDGAVVPVGQAALTAAGGAAAAASGVDALLVHPAVVAACAQLNGVPVVASAPAAPTVPAK
jgi:hypothetical protein